MPKLRRSINKKYLAAVAAVVVIGLVLSAFVGFKFGNSSYRNSATYNTADNTPANTANTANSAENGNSAASTPDNTANTAPANTANTAPSNTASAAPNNTANTAPATNTANGSQSEPKLTATELKARAASMQDYTIDPKTGMAKEIKVVDDNYLLLVNRTHTLAQTYVPDDLVTVKYMVTGVGVKGETDQLRKVAAQAFEAMVEAAAEKDIKIKMRTGYRSYAYQRDRLYNVYVKNFSKEYGQAKGIEMADTISARPGQSEHQTGLALDVAGESENYALSREFGNTKEGKWVAEHCHEFGFIIRYTDGTKNEPGPTTGFISEPWHLRYVGVETATAIHKSGQLFEEYLGIIT